MKPLLCSSLLLLTFSLNAQAPTAVPIPKEPHHHLVLENSYVRVFRVSVPAHEATLLHQHDVPYVYVALGPADVINAVQGKPEARIVMADGQLGYSRGGFAHIARNESDAPFNNVTIELLMPQGNARNICAGVVPDAPGPGICEPPRLDARIAHSIILFKTDELVAEHHSLGPKVRAPDSKSRKARLLIFDNDSPLRVQLPNKTLLTPKGSDVLWVEAGRELKITNSNQSTASSYLVLSFKHADDAKIP
ncbi:MAG TPA: hypothetical protein VGR03_07535 [Candidatus Acidoferrum sp.]|nr:hypothetical protein [Candidatus Acidoferrum sp.]